jgi:ABC-2 type transport system ATP-binding protein
VAYASIDTLPYEDMTIDQYYKFLASFKEGAYAKIEETTENLLTEMGIYDRRHTKIKHLSLGDKRKMVNASVKIGDNKIIMVDEPFEGLDAGSRKKMHKFFKTLIEQKRIIVLTTNSISDAEKISDW